MLLGDVMLARTKKTRQLTVLFESWDYQIPAYLVAAGKVKYGWKADYRIRSRDPHLNVFVLEFLTKK